MSPLEQELSSLRVQLEMNNAIVASLCETVDRLGIAIETVIRAITGEESGENPILNLLQTLLAMSEEQRSILVQLASQ